MDIEMFLDKYLHWEVGVASSPNSSGNVSPSGPFGEKGGGTHGLPRLLTQPPMPGPRGGHLCCPGSGAPDQWGKNWRLILPGI